MLVYLPNRSYKADLEESWENERTATPVRAFAVFLGNRLEEGGALLGVDMVARVV
jgi:hypothetical protein